MPTTAQMIEALVALRHDPNGVSQERFWQLVERFRADLVNQALAILGRQADAEDVAQESLCQAYQSLEQLRDPQALGNWLRSINRHNAVRLARHRRALERREERLPTGAQPVHADGAAADGRSLERVAKAIDMLPEEYRTVVVYRHWERLGYEEIAARLGVPIGTISSRMARAYKELYRRLQPGTALPRPEQTARAGSGPRPSMALSGEGERP